MELFGIAGSIPFAFLATALYRVLLLKAARRLPWISPVFRVVSYSVLALFGAELVLLATLGAIGSRAIVGPGFSVAHMIVFFLATPALANIILLRPRSGAAHQMVLGVFSLCRRHLCGGDAGVLRQ